MEFCHFAKTVVVSLLWLRPMIARGKGASFGLSCLRRCAQHVHISELIVVRLHCVGRILISTVVTGDSLSPDKVSLKAEGRNNPSEVTRTRHILGTPARFKHHSRKRPRALPSEIRFQLISGAVFHCASGTLQAVFVTHTQLYRNDVHAPCGEEFGCIDLGFVPALFAAGKWDPDWAILIALSLSLYNMSEHAKAIRTSRATSSTLQSFLMKF